MRKVLLIDNGSSFIENLRYWLENFSDEVKKVSYKDIVHNDAAIFTHIVLSGGHSTSVENHEQEFKKELEIIKETPVPILGVCLGFELISKAYGGNLTKLDKKQRGIRDIALCEPHDPIFENIQNLAAYESHRWTLKELPVNLIELARSVDGIEAVRHTNKKTYGLQFHPEVSLSHQHGAQIIDNFLSLN